MRKFIALFILVSIAITACGESGISKKEYDDLSRKESEAEVLGGSLIQQVDELESKASQAESKYANMSSKYYDLSKKAKETETKVQPTTTAAEETLKAASEPIELTNGQYIAGQDIPAGKYDVMGEASGNFFVASDEEYTGDVVGEISKKGEMVYKNLNLKDGYIVTLENGCKVTLTPVK